MRENNNLAGFFFFLSSPEDIFFPLVFRERWVGIEGREALIGCLLTCSPVGDGTHNLGMCLIRNQTHDISVYGKMLQPTQPHWPGNNLAVLKAPTTFTKSWRGVEFKAGVRTQRLTVRRTQRLHSSLLSSNCLRGVWPGESGWLCHL